MVTFSLAVYLLLNLGNVECDVCKRSFDRGDNLKRHKKTCTGINNPLCDQCGKIFIEMRYLKNHKKVCGIQNIQREESNEPPHKEGLRKVLEDVNSSRTLHKSSLLCLGFIAFFSLNILPILIGISIFLSKTLIFSYKINLLDYYFYLKGNL